MDIKRLPRNKEVEKRGPKVEKSKKSCEYERVHTRIVVVILRVSEDHEK